MTHNPYEAFGAEYGNQFDGCLLKFNKGKFLNDTGEVPAGTEYMALVPELRIGWVRFEHGKPAEHRIFLVRDGAKPPPRESLGYLEKHRWERPDLDPWQLQAMLPLAHTESGEISTFVTNSRGGRAACGDLAKRYARYATTSMVPVVSLRVASYEHGQYGEVFNPRFEIERWQDSGMPPPPMATIAPPAAAPAPALAAPKAAPKSTKAKNADMDDDVPF
jgi:hypothetical protein